MAKSIYVMSTEPRSGSSTILLGLADLVSDTGRKIAFFRPVIGCGEGRDPHIELLRSRFKLPFSYEDCFVCTLREARDLTNSHRQMELFERVLEKRRQIEEQCDFLICEGAPLSTSDAPFVFDLNSEMASHLNAPLAVISAVDKRSSADAGASLAAALGLLTRKKMKADFAFVNRSPKDAKSLLDALGNAAGQTALYLLPDSSTQGNGAQAVSDCTCGCTCPLPADSAKIDAALALFHDAVNGKDLLTNLGALHCERMTPVMFQYRITQQARRHKMRIVLPEGEEERILRAAAEVVRQGVADLVLLGDATRIGQKARELGLNLGNARLVEPCSAPEFEDYAQTYCELRKKKGITLEQARGKMADNTYFGTMMVYKDHADGMVSGSINTTAHTIRPAFEFIKTKPGFSNVSSVFLMCLSDRVLVFGDCAVNPNPTSEQLAEIAVTSAHTARVFGVEPRVALLSYSTGASGKGPDVDLVIEAVRLARERNPELALDGPLQYDAAIDAKVAQTKLPGSPVAGKATVFIFPDLDTGNNTYKAVQRAADAIAIGPVLQGLNKPVNDLSRGCLVPDIVNTVIITAVQAQADKGLL